jgi:hypothetical protein
MDVKAMKNRIAPIDTGRRCKASFDRPYNQFFLYSNLANRTLHVLRDDPNCAWPLIEIIF